MPLSMRLSYASELSATWYSVDVVVALTDVCTPVRCFVIRFDVDQSFFLLISSTLQRHYARLKVAHSGGHAIMLRELFATRQARMEIFAFLLVTAVLMPGITVATVGTYGLVVWVYQMVTGPPGPPQK